MLLSQKDLLNIYIKIKIQSRFETKSKMKLPLAIASNHSSTGNCNREIKQDPFDAKNNCWIVSLRVTFHSRIQRSLLSRESILIRIHVNKSINRILDSSLCSRWTISSSRWNWRFAGTKVSRKAEWRRYSYDCWISLALEVRSFRARIMQISVEIRSRNGREEMKGLAQLRIALEHCLW